VIVVGDLVNYWNHRLRHGRLLWPYHAVHHGPRALDWLSSVRMHPVDDLCDNVPVALVVLGLASFIQAPRKGPAQDRHDFDIGSEQVLQKHDLKLDGMFHGMAIIFHTDCVARGVGEFVD